MVECHRDVFILYNMCSAWLKTWESNDVSDIKIIIWRIEFNNVSRSTTTYSAKLRFPQEKYVFRTLMFTKICAQSDMFMVVPRIKVIYYYKHIMLNYNFTFRWNKNASRAYSLIFTNIKLCNILLEHSSCS